MSKSIQKWQRTTLGECTEVVSGATPKTDVPKYWDGDIYWTTPKDLSDLDGKYLYSSSRMITQEGLNSCAATVLPWNSVLFSSRAPIGLTAITKVPTATNQGCKSFIPKKDIVDPLFLLYWLRTNRKKIESLGVGATFKEVNKKVVESIEIDLPSISEQKRIAAILDSADAIRTKRQAAIENLDQLAQSVFYEMFGDPAKNEKGWERISLREEIEFMTSGSRGWAKYHSDEGELFIKIQNVKNSRLVFDNVQHIHPPKTQETNRTKVQEGDLLISITADLGRTAVVDCETASRGAYINQHLSLIRLRKNKLLPLFTSFFLESPAGEMQFMSLDQSAVKSGLNFESLNKLSVIVPPLGLQSLFIQRVEHIESLKQSHLLAFKSEESLFSSLQYRAFAGEL